MVPSNIYDPSFKAARKKQWCLGAGLGGGGSQTFLSYIWGGREFFSKMFCPPHENVTAPPPPHLVINDSSLMFRYPRHYDVFMLLFQENKIFGNKQRVSHIWTYIHKLVKSFTVNCRIATSLPTQCCKECCQRASIVICVMVQTLRKQGMT